MLNTVRYFVLTHLRDADLQRQMLSHIIFHKCANYLKVSENSKGIINQIHAVGIKIVEKRLLSFCMQSSP